MINIKKEDNIVLTILSSNVSIPVDRVDQKKWLSDLVGAALDYLLLDSSKGVAFLSPGRKDEWKFPTMIEVWMKERDMAVVIHRKFGKRMKDREWVVVVVGGWWFW